MYILLIAYLYIKSVSYIHFILDIGKQIYIDFSLSVKAAPHECVIRTGQP